MEGCLACCSSPSGLIRERSHLKALDIADLGLFNSGHRHQGCSSADSIENLQLLNLGIAGIKVPPSSLEHWWCPCLLKTIHSK